MQLCYFTILSVKEKTKILKLIFIRNSMKNMLKFWFILLYFLSIQCFGQDDVFTVVESQPEFPGGKEAFYEYVKDILIYPEIERIAKVEGSVFVQFIVEKNGQVTEVKTIKGIGDRCNAEAERVVKNAPHFIPGYNQGEAVRVRMMLPITFSLGSEVKQSKAAYRPLARSLEAAINDPNIEMLSLKFNRLTTLNKDIGNAAQLLFLDLTGNQLWQLPNEIGALNNLQELHLTNNQLTELPPAFSQLQSLKTLYLDRNEINEFPVELLELQNLKTIDISFTNISQLPLQIAEMPNLKIIYARGTNISGYQIKKIREVNLEIEILK